MRPGGLQGGFILLRVVFGAGGIAGWWEGAKDIGLHHLHDRGVDRLGDGTATTTAAASIAIPIDTTATTTTSTWIRPRLQHVFDHLIEDISLHLFPL